MKFYLLADTSVLRTTLMEQ